MRVKFENYGVIDNSAVVFNSDDFEQETVASCLQVVARLAIRSTIKDMVLHAPQTQPHGPATESSVQPETKGMISPVIENVVQIDARADIAATSPDDESTIPERSMPPSRSRDADRPTETREAPAIEGRRPSFDYPIVATKAKPSDELQEGRPQPGFGAVEVRGLSPDDDSTIPERSTPPPPSRDVDRPTETREAHDIEVRPPSFNDPIVAANAKQSAERQEGRPQPGVDAVEVRAERRHWTWSLQPFSPFVPFAYQGIECATIYDALGVSVGLDPAPRRERVAHGRQVAHELAEIDQFELQELVTTILALRNERLVPALNSTSEVFADEGWHALVRGARLLIPLYFNRRDRLLGHSSRRRVLADAYRIDFARRFGFDALD